MLLRLGNGSHPNIVHIFRPDLKDGRAMTEMEFIEGSDLLNYIADCHKFVPVAEVFRFIRDIGSALAYCHVDIYKFCLDLFKDEMGLEEYPKDSHKYLVNDAQRQELITKCKVTHNDLHSSNIMRKYDGSYILLDFGLAIQNGMTIRASHRRGGAQEYKPPEKWLDNNDPPRETGDVYSFGILMYEMLAGQAPFSAPPDMADFMREYELSKLHRTAEPPPIAPARREAFGNKYGDTWRRDYPDELETIIMRCLAKKPEDRYANAKELLAALLPVLDRHEKQGRQEELDKLKAKTGAMADQLARLQVENGRLTATKDNLEQQMRELTRQNKELGRDLDRMKDVSAQNADSATETRNLRGEIEDLKKRAAAKQTEIDNLRQQQNGKDTEIEKFQQQQNVLTSAMEKLTDNLRQVESELQRLRDTKPGPLDAQGGVDKSKAGAASKNSGKRVLVAALLGLFFLLGLLFVVGNFASRPQESMAPNNPSDANNPKTDAAYSDADASSSDETAALRTSAPPEAHTRTDDSVRPVVRLPLTPATVTSQRFTDSTNSDYTYTGPVNAGGMPDGNGYAQFADGRTYTGDFADGSRQGEGKMTWPNGDYYEGHYVADNADGQGRYQYANGLYYTGSWKNNAQWTGTTFLDDGTEWEKYVNGERVYVSE